MGENNISGDPAPNAGKSLSVEYSFNGATARIHFGEQQLCMIPGVPKNGFAQPGLSRDFKIVAARYGYGVTWLDVTDQVRTLVTNPKTPFVFDYGRDIAYGVHKHLAIWFEYRGRLNCTDFNDDTPQAQMVVLKEP